jgi:gliding motility-associated lipoprotein GldH
VCLFAMLPILLASCEKKSQFFAGKTFENSTWNRFDILEYDFDIENTAKNYDFILETTINEQFPIEILPLNITIYYPNGGKRSRDYDFRLKDAEKNWKGIVDGNKIKFEIPINRGMSLNQKGIYQIRIENKYTKYNLSGIENMYFFVYFSDK